MTGTAKYYSFDTGVFHGFVWPVFARVSHAGTSVNTEPNRRVISSILSACAVAMGLYIYT